MHVVFSPEAKREFEEAEYYYNRLVRNLVTSFAEKYVIPCHEYERGLCRVK